MLVKFDRSCKRSSALAQLLEAKVLSHCHEGHRDVRITATCLIEHDLHEIKLFIQFPKKNTMVIESKSLDMYESVDDVVSKMVNAISHRLGRRKKHRRLSTRYVSVLSARIARAA